MPVVDQHSAERPGRADRDRDAAGRARNSRPRDALGRPLARDAAGRPELAAGVPGEGEAALDQALPPDEALARAQELVDAGMPFHAHEVLEAAWKAAPAADRELWRGLAQLAVGLTHAMRGNSRGAAALLRYGAARLAAYPAPGPHDVDVAGLIQASTGLADRIEDGGLAGLARADLRLTLVIDR